MYVHRKIPPLEGGGELKKSKTVVSTILHFESGRFYHIAFPFRDYLQHCNSESGRFYHFCFPSYFQLKRIW